jgi:hypothetical protein
MPLGSLVTFITSNVAKTQAHLCYRKSLQEKGLIGSTSSAGNPNENAHIHKFMNTLKHGSVSLRYNLTTGRLMTAPWKAPYGNCLI